MYSEDLKFLFISKSLWMEQVLGEVAPLEDCTYHFATYADFFRCQGKVPGIIQHLFLMRECYQYRYRMK